MKVHPFVFLGLGSTAGTIGGVLLMPVVAKSLMEPASPSATECGMPVMGAVFFVLSMPFWGFLLGTIAGWCLGAIAYLDSASLHGPRG